MFIHTSRKELLISIKEGRRVNFRHVSRIFDSSLYLPMKLGSARQEYSMVAYGNDT